MVRRRTARLLTLVTLMFILFPDFLFPVFSYGATHYITQAGAGSRNGNDWSNAYQGLPSSLTRGDTYVVAGGSYSSMRFNDNESGFTVITIRKASSLNPYRDDLIAGWDSNYETDQVVFSGQTTFNKGYYTIDGITPSTGHWQTSGYGIKTHATDSATRYLVSTGSNSVNSITLKHIEFQHLGPDSDTEQFGIHPPDITATYDSWVISHNYFHDLQVFMKISGYAPNGWIIEHNYFGSNWSSSDHHGEQISFAGSGSSTPHHVRYNWFEPFNGTGSLIYLWYQDKTANDISIYGNVWHNPPSWGNGVIGTGSTGQSPLSYNNWKIYNNTFIGGTAQIAIGYADSPPTGWEIRNNLFYNCTTKYLSGVGPSGVFTSNYLNNSSWGWGTCTCCVTSTESSSVLFTNYLGGDYHGSGSQVNAGIDLGSPYDVDADGVSRPQGSTWDIGAYENITHMVTPSSGANGRISPSTPQMVADGATIQFTVTPNLGYTASAAGTCGGTLNGTVYTTDTVTADCTVTASFSLISYTVTPSAGANGSISPDTPQTVTYGSTTQFTVTPNSGYTAAVAGTCGGTLNGTVYTTGPVTADCTVIAGFAISRTVTPSAGANGSISPSTPQTVTDGATTQFTGTPNSGYTASVAGTCGGTLNGTVYTTAPVTADCTVIASFSPTTQPTIRTITVKSSGGDYPSLNAALAAEAGDLVALNRVLYVECYAMQDTTPVNLTGFTTDADHYIRIYTPASERHQGKWDINKYRLETNGQAINIAANYVRIEGLQIQVTASSGTNANGISTSNVVGAGDIRISYSIIKGVLSGTVKYSDGVSNSTSNNSIVVRIFNNLFLNWNRLGASTFIGGVYTDNNTAYYFNNTFVNCYQGMYRNGGSVVAKNNLMYLCNYPVGGTFAAGTDYNATDNASVGYTVTGGGNTHDRISQTFTFLEETNGDYHLASGDDGAKEHGISDPGSGLFSDDIDGEARPAVWDIGADER